MNFMRFTILLLCLLFSCKTSKILTHNAWESSCNLTFQPTPKTKLLMHKKWTEISIEVIEQQHDSTDLDITDQFMKSDLDDLIIFNADGTFVFDEGSSKARNESHQIYGKGQWALDETSSKLLLCMKGDLTIYDITTLNPELMVLQLEQHKSDESYTYVLTYQPLM